VCPLSLRLLVNWFVLSNPTDKGKKAWYSYSRHLWWLSHSTNQSINLSFHLRASTFAWFQEQWKKNNHEVEHTSEPQQVIGLRNSPPPKTHRYYQRTLVVVLHTLDDYSGDHDVELFIVLMPY